MLSFGYHVELLYGVAWAVCLISCLHQVESLSTAFEIYEDEDGLLQKVIVDESTGYVYVGGRNALYKLDKDLNLLARISTGPVQDSVNCDPPGMEICSDTALHDNDAKVLLDNLQVPGTLLFCGSVKQGLCSSINKTEFNSIHYLDPGNKYNFIGGKGTSTALFGKHLDHTQSLSVHPLYVGQQYDGRPISLSPEIFSSRFVRSDTYPVNISLLMDHPSGRAKSAKDVHADYKAEYQVRHITSFEYGKFTYFVTVQREELENGWYDTHVVRVCQEDPSYVSFAEIELYCAKMTSYASIYKVAEDAHFGKVGKDFAQRYGINYKEPVLYVTFGMDNENGVPNKSLGSVFCLYTMADILREFQLGLSECYEGRSRLLSWVYPDRKRCTFDHDAALLVRDDINYCYSDASVYNDAIRCGPIQVTSNFTLDEAYVTSLRVTIQREHTVALMGTTRGSIVKNLVDGTHLPFYVEIDIGEGLSNKTVAKDMALDPTEQYLYAMAAGRIVKVDIRTCAIYKDCASCVMASRDPLRCGWCDGYCSQEDHCASHLWSSNSCPPLFYQFEPSSGPLAGGTKVTITGENFGNFTAAVTKSVEVAYEACDIDDKSFTTKRIVCTTQPSASEKDSQVVVRVVDYSNTTAPFNIRGEADSSPFHFYYKDPQVHFLVPQKGPQSGETPLTISGKDLDIGSDTRVTVVDLPCEIDRDRSSGDALICVTSPLPDSESQHKRSLGQTESTENDSLAQGPVVVQIDGAVREMSDVTFSYYGDPEVFDVYPRRSIASGGMGLTVEGARLDVVHEPKLVLYDPVLAFRYNASDCHVTASDGSLIVCETPRCVTVGSHAPGAGSPLVLHINFAMDGVSELIDFAATHPDISDFRYYVDPVLYTIGNDGVLNFRTSNLFLDIKGKYLDEGASMDDYSVFIGGDSCDVVLLTSDLLRCNPIIPKPLSESEPLRSVTVGIGARLYEVGALRYGETNVGLMMAYILGPLLIVTIVFVTAVVLGAMKRYKKGPFRKKPLGPPVVFRADDGGEDAVSNSYMRTSQMWHDHQGAESEPLIDNEYRQFLEDANILIDRDKLKLLDVVGQGNFGCVYKGLLQYGEGKEEREVAVKTLKTLAESRYANSLSAHEARVFLEEALRMREFDHKNILGLIGICMENSEGQGQPMVVLPFMKHGDLLTYIRDESNTPTVKELMEFGIDIAEGMAYLSRLKFVHRDLAARNCMLDDRMRVQVADFGLSRDVYETDYYSSDGRRAKLPVKWMALESLEKGIYNSKTDVWSFGVLLWELMTRGVIPYPEVGNWEIIDYLKPGRRMAQPSYCPNALFDVMLECWHPDSGKRPTFQRLVTKIRTIISDMEAEDREASLETSHIYANVPTSQTYLYPQTQPTYQTSRDRVTPADESDMFPGDICAEDYRTGSPVEPSVSRDWRQTSRDGHQVSRSLSTVSRDEQNSVNAGMHSNGNAARDMLELARDSIHRSECQGQIAGSRSMML